MGNPGRAEASLAILARSILECSVRLESVATRPASGRLSSQPPHRPAQTPTYPVVDETANLPLDFSGAARTWSALHLHSALGSIRASSPRTSRADNHPTSIDSRPETLAWPDSNRVLRWSATARNHLRNPLGFRRRTYRRRRGTRRSIVFGEHLWSGSFLILGAASPLHDHRGFGVLPSSGQQSTDSRHQIC